MPRQLFFDAGPTTPSLQIRSMQPRAFAVRRNVVVVVCPSGLASHRGPLIALDQVPEAPAHLGMRGRRTLADLPRVDPARHDPADRPPDDRSKPSQNPPALRPRESHRALLSDPGVQRTVRYRDFENSLRGQLARPERLRDTHYLNCYVQVYEVSLAQPLAALAAAIAGDPRSATQFFLLTPGVARTLELIPLLTSRAHLPPHLQQARHIVWPSDRIVRLQVSTDPTADVAPEPDSTPNLTSARKGIPDRFMKPWEFRLGRDEVVYDMTVGATVAGSLASFLGRLWRGFRSGKEIRKWHALLAGHAIEEQLWSVRPPKDGLSQPAVREWARRTLEVAGYDGQTMIAEWEIFWRRKGLR